jgi:hypothetical protein
MKNKIFITLLVIASFLYVRKVYICSHHSPIPKFRITSKNRIGVTDTIGHYGDSIGWYNSNGTHVFFPKNSKIDTIKH